MRSVFLDTSAWLAALSTREALHEEVAECYEQLVRSGARLVTTNLVLAEMHALLVRRRGAAQALELLDLVRDDPSHELIIVGDVLQSSAIDRWLRRFGDQAFSLTDAVSFETMRQGAFSDALTLDHHFAAAGFRMLPEEPKPPRRPTRRIRRV